MSYAGANGFIVDRLLSHSADSDDPLRGIVIAGACNGTERQDLEAALLRAWAAGVLVLRATRCPSGRVLAGAHDAIPDSAGLSAVKARITLMLRFRSR